MTSGGLSTSRLLPGPEYFLVAEALAGNVAMRPLFGSPAGQVASPYWDAPLLALGREMGAAPGALVFALDGSFVGAIVRVGNGTGLAPADALVEAAARTADTPPRVPRDHRHSPPGARCRTGGSHSVRTTAWPSARWIARGPPPASCSPGTSSRPSPSDPPAHPSMRCS